MSISLRDRINRLSKYDVENWAYALAKVLVGVSVTPRPTKPTEPTEPAYDGTDEENDAAKVQYDADMVTYASDLATYHKNVKLDSYKRKVARDFAARIPAVLEMYVYPILVDPRFYIRGADHEHATAEQIADGKDWLLFDPGANPTSESPRQTLDNASAVISGLFDVISLPDATVN